MNQPKYYKHRKTCNHHNIKDLPNVVIPLSVASKYAMMKYGGASIDEAIQNFTTDLLAVSETPQTMEQTTNVPPSPEPQGLMTSPQTMEQV